MTTEKEVFECHFSDGGNAMALALTHGDDIRHVHGVGWHIWRGDHWGLDKEGAVRQIVARLARTRQDLIIKYETDATEKKRKLSHAIGLENTSAIDSCLRMAQSMPPFSVTVNDVDRDPMLLACPNGTIDLRSGSLRNANPQDMLTKLTTVRYDPHAVAPQWMQFLQEIFVHTDGTTDWVLINFIKRALGYSLTGKTTERCLMVLHGVGANGKSTFLNVVQSILGEYAGTTTFGTFLLRPNGGYGNDVAALQGLRFVSASEVADRKHLDEAKVKLITGDDPISCRFLYREYFTYVPTYKIWLACNHKPKITGTEEAIWDRIKLIPFNARFENGANQKPGLKDDLLSEAEGILAWMVDGCREWQSSGLADCQSIKDATRAYRHEEDAFARFEDEKLAKTPGAFTPTNSVWQEYNSWAKDNGEKEIKTTARVGTEMVKRGCRKVTRGNVRGFDDVAII